MGAEDRICVYWIHHRGAIYFPVKGLPSSKGRMVSSSLAGMTRLKIGGFFKLRTISCNLTVILLLPWRKGKKYFRW